MSARITLYCDTEWEYSACASQLVTDAQSIEEARVVARVRGWRTHSSGRDYCAGCSGGSRQPASAAVIELHPERT